MSKSPGLEAPIRLVLCAGTAADLMTPSPISINANATLKEAAAFLTERGVSAAPVIDAAGRPVGVLSRSDIVAHDRGPSPERDASPDYYSQADLGPRPARITWTDLDVFEPGSTPVREMMSPVVYSVPPEAAADKVIEELQARKVHRLFVVDRDGVLIGVVSTTDVLRHLRREGPGSIGAPGPPPTA